MVETGSLLLHVLLPVFDTLVLHARTFFYSVSEDEFLCLSKKQHKWLFLSTHRKHTINIY